MRRSLIAFACGLLFALGLGLSGMTLPSKVVAFLDVFGDWDPSLAFVMAGAIGVHVAAMRLLRGMGLVRGVQPQPPATTAGIDRSLVVGAAVFGVGWGLVGYCPGPAVVGLVTLEAPVLIVVAAIVVGMVVFHRRRG
ncbi:MAG: YeeE/YedE family protein [Deltaproteobacteria bacterium]|nr:YeeE/YedE family protein [Deltaproteobacteria bacterium]